jgi:hypothetical protein
LFVVVQRERREDAKYWPGRRLLASLDAVAWPCIYSLLVLQTKAGAGLMRPVVAVAGLWALVRLCVALLANHRYRFTTWLWLRFLAVLLLVWAIVGASMQS